MDSARHDSMVDHPARLALAMLVLVAIAVFAYWWWDPIRDPAIRFDPSTAEMAKERSAPGEDAEASIELASSEAPAPNSLPLVDAVRPPVETVGSASPQFRDYVIRRGDTLEGIARRELGSPSLASAIRRANPLKDMTRIKAGDTIRIPVDPTNIQGPPAASKPDDPRPSEAGGAVTLPGTYVVQRGDSLSKIAVKIYGSSRYTDLIFNANRSKLKSKDAVREGQKLVLPAKPD